MWGQPALYNDGESTEQRERTTITGHGEGQARVIPQNNIFLKNLFCAKAKYGEKD